ncbi:MAG: hypothetical protein M3Y59_17180 [Myxococcota bacterium]|nr:hypothetical protein [Myxococcota bacterium]
MRVLSIDQAARWTPSWTEEVNRCVRQEPLLDTRTSLAGMSQGAWAVRPRTIFMGVGLCARGELSRAVPLDLLGMLLPAEVLRRKLRCQDLVVLIADTHALANGFPPHQVEERALALEQVLHNIRTACHLPGLRILRASRLHQASGYQRMLLQVRSRAEHGLHEYLLQQYADVLYLHQQQGPVLKVGWSLPSSDPLRQRDEVILDQQMAAITGARLSYVYCKPARTLADASPRMPPYVVKRPESRLCLDRPDDPASKLSYALRRAHPSTVAGFRKHLKRLVYTYGKVVEPLPRGTLTHRVAAMMARIAIR